MPLIDFFRRLAAPKFQVVVLSKGFKPVRATVGAYAYDVHIGRIVEKEHESDPTLGRKLLWDFYSNAPEVLASNIYGDGRVQVYRLLPGETVRIGLGILMSLPIGAKANVVPRGSTVEKGLAILNQAVPIDWDFRGEPCALVRNETSKHFDIFRGSRLFQIDLVPFCEMQVVSELTGTNRGNGCHGSTDRTVMI